MGAHPPSRPRSCRPGPWAPRATRDDRASAAIEAVLVIPVLMLVLVVVVQCAMWAHAGQVVGLAASEGDRTARSVDGGPAAGAGVARSILQASGRDLASSNVVAEVVSGDLVRVTVTGRAVSIIPGLSLPVSSVVVGPLQEFRSSE
jgi:Flp pilus assembly protein TadG